MHQPERVRHGPRGTISVQHGPHVRPRAGAARALIRPPRAASRGRRKAETLKLRTGPAGVRRREAATVSRGQGHEIEQAEQAHGACCCARGRRLARSEPKFARGIQPAWRGARTIRKKVPRSGGGKIRRCTNFRKQAVPRRTKARRACACRAYAICLRGKTRAARPVPRQCLPSCLRCGQFSVLHEPYIASECSCSLKPRSFAIICWRLSISASKNSSTRPQSRQTR